VDQQYDQAVSDGLPSPWHQSVEEGLNFAAVRLKELVGLPSF
jgi:hypothetical protein